MRAWPPEEINRVSVVTPVYNGERYLGRLLESVCSQSWPWVEMIVSDDGSQDDTLEIAETFRERFEARGFPFYIVSGKHQNASAAINRALPLVTGEFLIWPDSDDVLHTDSIRKRVEFLRANPEYQCVRSLSRYEDENGDSGPLQEKLGYVENEELFFPVLLGDSFVCCGCYMLRCAPFFEIYPDRQIPEYEVGQNFQILLPFLYAYRCPTLREELYTVYIRPDSHSRRTRTQREDEKRNAGFELLVDEIADICRISDQEERFRVEVWKHRQRYTLYVRHRRRWAAAVQLLWLWQHGDLKTVSACEKMVNLLCSPRVYQFLQVLYRRLKRAL